MSRAVPWAVAALGSRSWWRGSRSPSPPAGRARRPTAPAPSRCCPPTGSPPSRLEPTVDGTLTWWTAGDLAGAGPALVGALLLSGTGGWALGRRSARAGA